MHHMMHCIAYALKNGTAISVPERQAGVKIMKVVTQPLKVAIHRVKFNVPEGMTDVDLIDHTPPT